MPFRIIKRLGCANCQPCGRNFVADQLRGKVRLLLNKLRLLNEKRFEKYKISFFFLSFIKNFILTLDVF